MFYVGEIKIKTINAEKIEFLFVFIYLTIKICILRELVNEIHVVKSFNRELLFKNYFIYI